MQVRASAHISAWARALCISALGEDAGEKMWRSLPANTVIAWWMLMLHRDVS